MNRLFCLALFLCVIGFTSCAAPSSVSESAEMQEEKTIQKEYYELRIYEAHSEEMAGRLDTYLSATLVPSLNTYGIPSVGIFSEIESDRAWRYVLIPYKNVQQYLDASGGQLSKDMAEAGAEEYKMTSKTNPVYDRIKSSFFEAFDSFPIAQSPLLGQDRIFALRIYESQSEEMGKRKLEMFNVGEIPIFHDAGLTPVFFGEALSGYNLPNLTYMLTFKDTDEMKAAWKAFSVHPDWIALKANKRYDNTVSYIANIMLKPTTYSQF